MIVDYSLCINDKCVPLHDNNYSRLGRLRWPEWQSFAYAEGLRDPHVFFINVPTQRKKKVIKIIIKFWFLLIRGEPQVDHPRYIILIINNDRFFSIYVAHCYLSVGGDGSAEAIVSLFGHMDVLVPIIYMTIYHNMGDNTV